MQVRGHSDLLRDHGAEGVGFEPTMSVTTHSGFQDTCHRPLNLLQRGREANFSVYSPSPGEIVVGQALKVAICRSAETGP